VVSVSDNGPAGQRRQPSGGGGNGLAGLAERLEEDTRPHESRQTWAVRQGRTPGSTRTGRPHGSGQVWAACAVSLAQR
jgi:hypothetical protein